MGTLPIERIKLAFHRFRHGIAAGEPAVCGYGKTPGAEGDCDIMVAPHEGYRRGHLVFCSDDHAAKDQQEQLF